MDDQSKKFVFVDQSTNEGRVPDSKAVRRRIRKQAMHDAGLARRQSGHYGQHNLRQYPAFVSPGQPSLINNLANATDMEYDPTATNAQMWQAALLVTSIPAKMPPRAYEILRRDLNFDVTQLSPMTSLYFSRGRAHALASRPVEIGGMLRTNDVSYLNFLPIRYQDNPLLQDVLFCIAAQSQWLLRPQSAIDETKILAAYGHALERLQKALTDPDQCLHPDVLCATQVLGLFEVLKFYRAERWQDHLAGASRIIQNRGPARFKSEYERALLSSVIGAIITETLFNNQPCFLDQKEWRPVFNSLVLNDVKPFADRSKLSIDLWHIIVGVPRLWKQVTDLICHRDRPDPGLAMELTLRAYKLQEDIKQWSEKVDAQLKVTPEDVEAGILGRGLSGVSWVIRIVVNRLIVSLSPSTAFAIEQEAQHFAKVIYDTEREAHGDPGTCDIKMFPGFAIANSTIQTRENWKETCMNLSATSTLTTSSEWMDECLASKRVRQCLDESGVDEQAQSVVIRRGNRSVIPKWVFERWCNILGRKTN